MSGRKSRKKPIRKISNILKNKNTTLPDSSPAKLSRIIESPPRPLNTSEKAVAPTKIINTMLVNFMVKVADSRSAKNVKFLLLMAKRIAPMLPKAADSVGEATPKIIEPNTTIIKNSGGTVEAINERHLIGPLLGILGTFLGFNAEYERIYKM